MYQIEYIGTDNKKDINQDYFSKTNQMTKQIDKSLLNFPKLEQDVFSYINYLRKNPLEFCNNLIQQNKHKTNSKQNEIINFLQEIHSKKVLKPFIEIPELSLAAKSLLDKIIFNYKQNHNLNLKDLEPTKKNLRERLSKYGERTGKIFETVLFEIDNPDDIVNHILLEEKGRNMLLNNEMKYIGISCDLIDQKLLCTVIDIVQDFIPYKINNNINNINNNINNNIYMMYNNNENNNYNFNKSNYGKLKHNYFYNQSNFSNNNTNYFSFIQNLSNKNDKENLKLKILPRKKTSDIPMNIRMDINLHDNYNLTNNNIQINLNEGKNIYYKTPKKIQFLEYKNPKKVFSPKHCVQTNMNVKKIFSKRINSGNINTLKKDLTEVNKNDTNNLDNISDVKFKMAGRTNLEQQNIIETSKKNMNKSKSVCSFDGMSVNSKNGGKNKFQRLKHEEKMAILHKINNRNMKTPDSKPLIDKNAENINYIQKNEASINGKKSPSIMSYNQELLDFNSDTEKNNLVKNNYTEYIYKTSKNYDSNNFDNENNQTTADIRSFQGDNEMNNEEYSRKKLNEIKNDIKNQLKEELKKEFREEIQNEFNKKLSNGKPKLNRNINEINQNKKINNNINNKIYYNKNKKQNRWTSVKKYNYNINDSSKKNNSINSNLYCPDNKTPYSKKNKNIYYKGRKSFDWREFAPKNKNNEGFLLKQKYQERYTKTNFPVNYIYANNNYLLEDNLIEDLTKRSFINKENTKNLGDKIDNIFNLNQIYKPKTKKEIKKLIKMYNMAQDDKRNKNMAMNNSSSYNIINNNKSINNCLINDTEINSDIVKIDLEDKKIIPNEIENNNKKINNNDNQPIIKNIIKTMHIRNPKKLNEKEQKSDDNFVKGHRFQIKYEKVKSKSQMYKEIIPKKRKFSMNQIDINIDDNIINNIHNRSFISDISSPMNYQNKKKEDINNIINSDSNYQNKIINDKKNEQENNSNDKLMKTGRFVNVDVIKSNEEIAELKNFMDENVLYKESKEKPIISKIEKFEGNSVITTIITKTKKIYIPDKEKTEQNLIKDLQQNIKRTKTVKNIINMEKINDFEYTNNDAKSVNNKNLNNTIKTKNISLKMNFTDKKNNICKTPDQKLINTQNNYIHDFNFYSGNQTDNENLEKKYIKDPEGNLIETLVKKTQYKDGSILLEYV